MTWRRPVWALHVLVVGLALHNLVVSQLWRAGLRGTPLTVVSAWKDVLLLVALALVVHARRRALLASPVDRLALAFAAFVVVYALLPQSWLGGGATHKGILYAARHDLLPVGAYFLGRGLQLTGDERRRVCRTVLLTAAVVAAYGLVDVFLVPLSFWRHSAGWYSQQLGLGSYRGLSGLPENFVYNAGGNVVFRRLTSTFLSPLATAYLLVVALFFVPFRSRRFGAPVALLLFAALLWTHTRAALVALVLGLLVLFAIRRRLLPLALAAVVVVLGFAFTKEYGHVAPRTHLTRQEIVVQEQNAKRHPGASNQALSANESSLREHWASLKAGVRTVVHHPQGFGLGNAGVTAERTHVAVLAGESTYTELGVETGLAGALVFVAWSLALCRATLRRAWLAAAFAAVLLLGLQTDVIGIPWIAVVVWALAGDAAAPSERGP